MREAEKLKREFQLEEFRYLTAAVSGHVENQVKLERYTLLGIAAIYGWLFARQPLKALPVEGDISAYGIYIFWLPPLLILFAMFRSVSLLFTLEMIYAYLKEIELKLSGQPGWQVFVVEYRKQKPRGWLFRFSLTAFWIAILTISTVVAWHFAPLRAS
jgi:hypothetical protein